MAAACGIGFACNGVHIALADRRKIHVRGMPAFAVIIVEFPNALNAFIHSMVAVIICRLDDQLVAVLFDGMTE